ncbi:Photosystem I assembly protein Ycf3 [Burkholderia lata]|uniref:Photosystem I assembly protein Ycf3 n=1 Tax=Burkholderia lata (strain ATCC 17760 / DSM 23089 / LMG 22485 / NCIMB 9086 / R18194 / 383) TaxID=482957 RepID=A0A6P2T4F4_BURL3|nr:tetratricopeptide repeat protein [Burkholderia lata]VWC50900.1 Photosystem I assembly protein Ycf3 [Burkholderia lata]
MDKILKPADIKAAELEAKAERHFIKRELHDTLICLQQAISIRKESGDWNGAGDCAQSEGYVRFVVADHAGAIRSYEEALEFRKRTNDLRGQGVTCGRLAEVFQHIGEHAKAVELLESALQYFERINAPIDISTIFNNMAVSYREMGVADKARQCYERSLEIRRQVGDFDGIATTLLNVAVLYIGLSHYDCAHLFLEEARDLRREMGDNEGLGRITLHQGRLHEEQGDILSAIECYEDALNLARSGKCIQSRIDEAIALLNLADALSNQGKVDSSLANLDVAAKLFLEAGVIQGIAMTYYGRGRTLAAAGRSTEALACFGVAKSHFKKIDDRPRLISTGIAIGKILSSCRQHREARDEFVSALELQQQLSLPQNEAITQQLIRRECAALGDETGGWSAASVAVDRLGHVITDPGFDGVAIDNIANFKAADCSMPDAEQPAGPYSLH